MKNCRSDEKIICYAQTIGLLVSKKAEIGKLCYDVEKFLKLGIKAEFLAKIHDLIKS